MISRLFLLLLLMGLQKPHQALYDAYIFFGMPVHEAKMAAINTRSLEFVKHDSVFTFSPKYQVGYYQNRLHFRQIKNGNSVLVVFDINGKSYASDIEIDTGEVKPLFVLLSKKYKRNDQGMAVTWNMENEGYAALSKREGKSTAGLYYARGRKAAF